MSSRAVRLVVRVLIAGACAALGLVIAPSVRAATITVTTNADENVTDGNCSLREAIHAAVINAAVDACTAGSGADTVSVPAGTYAIGSTLELDVDLTIQGAGRDATVLDGEDAVRVFHVSGPAGPVEIRDLSIERGRADFGGALSSAGGYTTTLRNVAVRHCSTNARGGAISGGGAISILDSVFESNSAGGQPSGFNSGGAIYMWGGTLRVERSRFAFNTVTGTGGEQYGGAIHFASTGNLDIVDSSFVENAAGYCGGAISAVFGDVVSISNSTFEGNTAGSGGKGGALMAGYAAYNTHLDILNSTFSANLAGGPELLYGSGAGGALALLGPGSCAHCTFADNHSYSFGSIVGDNVYDEANGLTLRATVLTVPNGANCRGYTPTSDDFNLASDESCALPNPSDVEGVDPLLGPIGDNGGATRTHLPLPGSPLIDGVLAPVCPATDQRGVARPQDGDDDGIAHCDIGAVEVAPEPASGLLGGIAVAALGARARRSRKARQKAVLALPAIATPGLSVAAAGLLLMGTQHIIVVAIATREPYERHVDVLADVECAVAFRV